MFPPGYVPPPVASVWNWGALFDFHNSSPGGGQPNFMVYATPTGLELHMAGGANTVNPPSDPGYYSIAIGPITKNGWYDFVRSEEHNSEIQSPPPLLIRPLASKKKK